MRFPRLPRFVRRLRLPSVHLPARWQRRLQQFRARLVAAVVYPISLVGYLFVEIGHRLLQWWSHRNLRYLVQGLPAVLLSIAAVVFAVVVVFQDRNLLANEYHGNGYRAQRECDRLRLEGKEPEAEAALKTAQTCYQRLTAFYPDNAEYRF